MRVVALATRIESEEISVNYIYRHPNPETTGETAMAAHHGQRCEIIRPLRAPEDWDGEQGPMFRVRFADEDELDVFGSEIEWREAPSDFEDHTDDDAREDHLRDKANA